MYYNAITLLHRSANLLYVNILTDCHIIIIIEIIIIITLVSPQALSSPAHSRTPTSFTSEDPALLRCRPMPYGLKPSQLNWQKEVTYDERGNIIDMIKLDPATFRPKRYLYNTCISTSNVHCTCIFRNAIIF